MTRLVYNRVNKAGSMFMINILRHLSRKHHFSIRVMNLSWYHPSRPTLELHLQSLPDDTVYINHAGFLSGAASDLRWINVVRDPVERWASYYYFAVDPAMRGEQAATSMLAERRSHPRCGCADLEFDHCIDVMYHNNCSIRVPSQISYFCDPGERCTGEQAMDRVRANYVFVGLTEELELTLIALQKLLPRFFTDAVSASRTVNRHTTPVQNPLTNTTMNGCISNRARSQIAARSPNYAQEERFYQDVKRLFWVKVSRLAPPEGGAMRREVPPPQLPLLGVRHARGRFSLRSLPRSPCPSQG